MKYANREKTKVSEVKIMGEPTGSVDELKEILRYGLLKSSFDGDAFLSIIRIEHNQRLALFLKTDSYENVIQEIGKFCFENIGELDLFNVRDLPEPLSKELKTKISPFFLKNDMSR